MASHGSGGYHYAASFISIPRTRLTKGAELVGNGSAGLESYVTSASEYPRGSTVFSPISLRTAKGIPPVKWTPVSDNTGHVTFEDKFD